MPQSPASFSAAEEAAQKQDDVSRVLIALLKGILYRDVNESLWQKLIVRQSAVRDYVAVLGLQLMLDEAEGYAWLASIEFGDPDDALPRLVAKRQVSFLVSLLLALLRRRLVESDASSDGLRLMLSRDDMVEMMRVFLPRRSNEAITVRHLDHAINQIVQLGYLRPLAKDGHTYEVRRIIKAFVDADWLADFDSKLTAYLASRGLTADGEEGDDDGR